jgi:hypothetical protein
MPYISQARRKELYAGIDVPVDAGELNYALTLVCLEYIEYKGLKYQSINDVLGALEGTKQEFYRRTAAPYEDKKLDVAGPMSGIPQFNFPAFFKAREDLTAMGYDVILPFDMDDPKAVEVAYASTDGKLGISLMTWGQCLARDVELICDKAGGIIFLPGWQKSRGARLEAFTALLHPSHVFKEFDFTGPPVDVKRGYVTQQLFINTK